MNDAGSQQQSKRCEARVSAGAERKVRAEEKQQVM